MMRSLQFYKLSWMTAIFMLLFSSCKKDIRPEVLPVPTGRLESQLLNDSVYYYFSLYSLWSDDATFPDAQTLQSFTEGHDAPESVLAALRALTPFHVGYKGEIDRFSYLEEMDQKEIKNRNSSTANRGFGLFVSIGAKNKDTAYPVVYFVESGSSADQAGLRRSDIILKVDEQDLSIPVSCETQGCQVLDQKVYQAVINKLLAAMEQPSMRLKVQHRDERESEITIASSRYDVNPIIQDTVFSFPEKSIGYLALSSFEDLSEGAINRVRLDHVFDNFEQHQAADLILDLRYNTGGYVSAAEHVANKIIGVDHDGALMYTHEANAWLSQHSDFMEGAFDDVYFKRKNNLNLNTVYFLVTDITASASELLINVLRPYMNVVIIAEQKGTYGKPVGFFKQEIMGKVSLWVASFKLVNARGETDYWDGIAADRRNVADNIFRDFGDVEETMIASAIEHALGKNKSVSVRGNSYQILPYEWSRMRNVNEVPKKQMHK